MLGAGGFDAARDIAAITVNRWPHGYAYQYNSLWDPFWLDGKTPTPCEVARRPFGRMAIANSDAGAYAYADGGHRPGPPRRPGADAPRMTSRSAAASPPAPAPHFDRVLGQADLLLFSVCAILTIDTLASAASMGVTWFAWWAHHDGAVLHSLRPHDRGAGRGLAGRRRPLRLGARGHGPALGTPGRLVLLDQQRLLDPVRLHGVRGHLPHHLPARAPAARSQEGRGRRGSRPASPSP